MSLVRQVSQLLNTVVGTRMFTDSRPLLDSIGSSRQIEEKNLRNLIAAMKQSLEDGEVEDYSWITGEEMVADMFRK